MSDQDWNYMWPQLATFGGLLLLVVGFFAWITWAQSRDSRERADRLRREDEAHARFSVAAFNAACNGVNLGFLESCPDVSRLAVEWDSAEQENRNVAF